jgi:3-oxoacyl-[acyl-carrier protein] reductase
MNLKGKAALITGGSKGIGKAIAIKLATEGVSVAINYGSDDKSAEETLDEIISINGNAIKVKAKVEEWMSVKEMVGYVKERFGEIDILVNNAGIARDAPIVYMKPEDFLHVVNVNLVGCFNCIKAVSISMIKRKKGSIINISSISAVIGAPGQGNYSSSKGGIISLTKSLAREFAPFNVRVNAIAPGLTDAGIAEKMDSKQKDKVMSMIPVGRLGKAEEVAYAAAFLASDLSRYITGQTLIIDGGLSL